MQDKFFKKNHTGIFFLIIYSVIITLFSENIHLQHDAIVLVSEIIRIANGDIVYRDYLSALGLIASYIAIFPIEIFKLNPIIVISIYGVLQNVLASLIVTSFLNKMDVTRSAALLGGFITATWFTPQVGGVYYDNIAILFGLFGFFILIDHNQRLRSNNYIYLISGSLFALAILTKQNSGGVLFMAAIITILLYKNFINFVIFLVGFVLLLLLYLIIIEQFGLLDQYLYHGFERIFEYNNNEERLSFERIKNLILMPYGINLFEINKLGLGQILFFPNYIFFYFYTILFIKSIFNLKKEDVAIVYIWLSLVGITLTVGRGMFDIQYFIGFIAVITLIKFFKSKYILIISSIYLILSGCLFFIFTGGNWASNKDLSIKDRLQSRISQIINNDTEIRLLLNQIGINKKISMIGISFKGSLFDMGDFLSTNYVNFWTPFTAEKKYLEWSSLEAKNIYNHNPDFVIIHKNYIEIISNEYPLKIVLDREYFTYINEKDFFIFKKNLN